MNINGSSKNNRAPITGRYVNYTFLDQIPRAIIGHIRVSCYEMNFISADSVEIRWVGWDGPDRFAYIKEDNHYRVLLKDSLLFTFSTDDGSITLVDSTMMSRNFNSIFRRVDPKVNLDELINQRSVSGEYTLYKNGKSTKQKVVFMPNGKITGLKKYTKYSICYSGDCVEMTLDPCNTIDLYSYNYKVIRYKDGGFTEKNPPKKCAFTISDNGDKQLKMYNLGPSPKDMKGEMPIKELLFDLRQ